MFLLHLIFRLKEDGNTIVDDYYYCNVCLNYVHWVQNIILFIGRNRGVSGGSASDHVWQRVGGGVTDFSEKG
jgi:hypothetical protein